MLLFVWSGVWSEPTVGGGEESGLMFRLCVDSEMGKESSDCYVSPAAKSSQRHKAAFKCLQLAELLNPRLHHSTGREPGGAWRPSN